MDFKFLRGSKLELSEEPMVMDEPISDHITPFMYEPMRVNRFLLTLPQELNIEPFFVRGVNGPSMTMNQNGVTRWDDFEFTLYDAIGPSVRQRLIEYTRGDMNNNLEFTLQMLDPTGITVSEWKIYGYIRSVDFGELNYGIESNCEIKVTLSVNRAVLIF